MIYIGTLLVVFLGFLFFDTGKNTKGKKELFWALCLWFSAVSGFQYMVGSDIPFYARDYEELSTVNFSIKEIFSHSGDRQQPGWLLLLYVCRFITSDFTLPKAIIAFFLNFSVFSFFQKESKYPFLCIFIYGLLSYLVLNFNALRQSVSLAFFLCGYPSLKDNRIVRYCFFAFLAFMFHNSAIILFALPLLQFVRIEKVSPLLLSTLFVLALIVISTIDLESLSISLIESGLLGDDMSVLAEGYMNSERLGMKDNASFFSIRRVFYIGIALYSIFKSKNPLMSSIALLYLIIDVISAFMPILFRFRLYFEIPFIISIADVVMSFPFTFMKGKFKRLAIPITAVFLFALIHTTTSDYFVHYPGSKLRYIDQYYPYHSILDPVIEYDRYNYFQFV